MAQFHQRLWFFPAQEGGADAFGYLSAIERAGMRECIEGQSIGYEIERDNKLMSACNLRRLDLNFFPL